MRSSQAYEGEVPNLRFSGRAMSDVCPERTGNRTDTTCARAKSFYFGSRNHRSTLYTPQIISLQSSHLGHRGARGYIHMRGHRSLTDRRYHVV